MFNMLLPAQLSHTPCQHRDRELRSLRRVSARRHKLLHHPLKPGQVFKSPGGMFRYRIVGACCRLYDRENLPYPCSSLEWHGKQPSWRRIGKRFVPDIAVKQAPSYCVQLLDYPDAEPFVMTLHWMKLSDVQQEWWYRVRVVRAVTAHQPVSTTVTSVQQVA